MTNRLGGKSVLDILFPTTVIGSLRRPACVRELMLDRKASKISQEEVDRLLDPTGELALHLQKRAGLEEITDGEWRCESYVKVFSERVRGISARSDRKPGIVLPNRG